MFLFPFPGLSSFVVCNVLKDSHLYRYNANKRDTEKKHKDKGHREPYPDAPCIVDLPIFTQVNIPYIEHLRPFCFRRRIGFGDITPEDRFVLSQTGWLLKYHHTTKHDRTWVYVRVRLLDVRCPGSCIYNMLVSCFFLADKGSVIGEIETHLIQQKFEVPNISVTRRNTYIIYL